MYGVHAITSNVHNLCHVVENVERFGNLNSISTYPFENKARHIKLKLKQCNKSIEQASRRILEMDLFKQNNLKKSDIPIADSYSLKYPFDCLNQYNLVAYKYMCYKNIIFSCKKQGDEWFLTKTNEIVRFNFVVKFNGQLLICGSPLKVKNDVFTQPFKSSYIDIYMCEPTFETDKSYNVSEIKCKMFYLNANSQYVFVPMLHTLDIIKK